MLVKMSSLFFLVTLSVFGQNPFNDELNSLKNSSTSIELEQWNAAQSTNRSPAIVEDSISLNSSGLQKQLIKPENSAEHNLQPYKFKKIRKRSR